jgi:hypothetical protein
MKLLELVSYFRKGGIFEEFCQQHSLNFESEVVEIYMAKPFSIDNDLAFFEIENTEGKIEYVFNGENYFNLFDFYYFQDAIEESNSDTNLSLSDETIAKRLYDYAMNDA